MKYVGSKNRHAKHILPIILKDRRLDQWYVEPFMGGCNMIDKVPGKRIANDANPYVVAMFEAIQNRWEPPLTVSENEYSHIKHHKTTYPKELVGFVGIGCSFAGKWFGGYARGNNNAGHPRNYAAESTRNLLRQKQRLDGVIFSSRDYLDLHIPDNSIVYCDPPYEGCVRYRDGLHDYSQFWNWCRSLHKSGHSVFVSEYAAPADFDCVWESRVHNTLDRNTGAKQGTERLFVPT